MPADNPFAARGSGSGGRDRGKGGGRWVGRAVTPPRGGGYHNRSDTVSQDLASGHKREREDEEDEVSRRKHNGARSRLRFSPYATDDAAYAYARALNGSIIDYIAYKPGQYEITRNEQGEIVNLAIKPGEMPRQRLLPSALGATIALKRVSIDLGEHLISRNEEYERKYESFARTQSNFEPTWYTWDEVTVVRSMDGNIIKLTPKGPENEQGNFIIKPNKGVAGIVGKFMNGFVEGLRTQTAMFEALREQTGAGHAFAHMETAHLDQGIGDQCIMSLFPDLGVSKPDAALVAGSNEAAQESSASQVQHEPESKTGPTRKDKGKATVGAREEIAATKASAKATSPEAAKTNESAPQTSAKATSPEAAKTNESAPQTGNEEIHFYSVSELEIKRDSSSQIVDLIPKDQSKNRVNFLALNPDKLGYIAKYDLSDKGKQTRRLAEERLVQETGCSLVLGHMVPVPGQQVDDPAEFQFVQTISLAQPTRGMKV